MIFFPRGARKCVLRLRTTLVKKSDFFAKRDFVQFFRTRARMFRIFGQNVPKGVEKLHPTCPKDHFAGKILIEILSFYIFFRTLREVALVLRRKNASRVGETAIRASRKFFQEKQILCKKKSVANHFQTVHEKRSEE